MRSLLLALALTFVCAQSASAIEVGMQDDQTIVWGAWDRDLALKQFKAMDGTIVRININHKRNHKYGKSPSIKSVIPDIKVYDAAVDAVRAKGLKVHLTLVWHATTNARRVAKWMANIARHYKGKVAQYSILNEPDLYLPAHGKCSSKKGRLKFQRRFPSQVVYRGSVARMKILTVRRTLDMKTSCARYRRGQYYRQIVNHAAAAIHRADSKAKVLAGETSGSSGLEWFVRGVDPDSLDVDGWAHHPFSLRDLNPKHTGFGWGIGNLKGMKKLVHLPLYLTEFGFPRPNSSMDKKLFGRRLKPSEIAKALPRAWKIARKAHVKEMLQYQWFKKPKYRGEYWDTAINNVDNGKTTPAYKALRKLLRSWR